MIPEINIALLAGHDMLFLGEKGQAKSRLMRLLVRFLDEHLPYLDDPAIPLHDDPAAPITSRWAGGSWPTRIPATCRSPGGPASERYAERLAPGTKFADIIGEIDPAKLAGGTSMSSEEALHFGLIPRMHRGIFAMNELPELDELVQVGMFNILEERDVQIRGYPVKFDIDVMLLFSANPVHLQPLGQGDPAAQGPDRRGDPHALSARPRPRASRWPSRRRAIDLGGEWPVVVPHFMKEILEQITIAARKSKFIDQQSGVSARFSIANFETVVASARQRGVRLGEKPAVPRISDLGHLYASSLGKLELDLMGSHQMSERQVLDAVIAEAIATVFEEYVEEHGLDEIAKVFGQGVKVEVGDMVPSAAYEGDRGRRARRVGQGLRGQRREGSGRPRQLHRVRARRALRHRADLPHPGARPHGLRHQRLSMMPTRDTLGGIVHTYQQYDPARIPPPRPPAVDLVTPAMEHLLEFGDASTNSPRSSSPRR